MLGAIGFAGVIGNSKPIAFLALISFACLIRLCSKWSPTGNFGWANGVTTLRLLLVLYAAYGLHGASGFLFAALVVGILSLDGIDGWLARHTGSASAFGAHFDMETDALLILIMTQELWQRGALGLWILTSGLLRYVYVLHSMIASQGASLMPRSSFGRVAFATLTIGLATAFGFPNILGALAAAVGTVLVSVSFARSFYWTWRSTGSAKRGI